ncbi:MAG: PEP-utilizing enzyme [Patescibacteria group bacterium]
MKIDLKNWYKFFNRPLTLHQAQTYSISCQKPLKKIIGRGINSQLYLIKKDSADGYFLNKEWEKFNNYFFNNRFLNSKFLQDINNKVIRRALFIEKYFRRISKINLNKVSDKELACIFKESIKVLDADVSAIWVGFILGDITEKKLIEVLLRNKVDIKTGLEIVGSLEKPHYIIQEQLDLMKIILDSSDRKKLLKKHWAKYSYIPCYSAIVKPYSLIYFQNRAEKISRKQAREFIDKTKKEFQDNKNKYASFIKNYSWSKIDKLFLDYAHQHFFLKDHRSHFRSLSSYQHGRILDEIAKRYKISLKNISLLLHQEIIELFKNSKKIKQVIEKRKAMDCVYIFKDGKDTIVDINEIVKRAEKQNVSQIKGQVACPGIVSGYVKIVINPNDIAKVKSGDILVSTMTRPDYLAAMKKAKAIITDEGGLLCHAAIVSREIKKPCIIGTKIATQILKDGDFIKVDANKGVVEKYIK